VSPHEKQERLFDPERFSPAHPDVVLRLPEGSARAFWLASQLGRFIRTDGSSYELKSVAQAAGTLVTVKRRGLVLSELGIGVRRWEQLIKDWEARLIAHRCSPGSVFLFAHSTLDECPACHAELLVTEAPPSPRRDRGEGFAERRDTSPQSEELLRSERTTPSPQAALSLRPTGTKTSHLSNGYLPRDEVGLRTTTVQIERERQRQLEALEKDRLAYMEANREDADE
jgi:hypothetical protein